MKLINPIPGSNAVPRVLLGALFLAGSLAGCTPTVKIEVPREPITINLNIKLDADIRLQIEEQAKRDVETNPIF